MHPRGVEAWAGKDRPEALAGFQMHPRGVEAASTSSSPVGVAKSSRCTLVGLKLLLALF